MWWNYEHLICDTGRWWLSTTIDYRGGYYG